MPGKQRRHEPRKHQEIKRTDFKLREEAGRLEGQGHHVVMGPTVKGLAMDGERHKAFGLPHRATNMTKRYLGWTRATEKGHEKKTSETHWFVDQLEKTGIPAHRKRKTK